MGRHPKPDRPLSKLYGQHLLQQSGGFERHFAPNPDFVEPVDSPWRASFFGGIASAIEAGLKTGEPAPETWREWVTTLFPAAVHHGFAEHHCQLWDWAWSIERGVKPRPYVAVWPRKGGKSTLGELVVTALGARGVRRYAVFVSETQDQADTRVAEVAARLEGASIERYYPQMGERAVGKFGAVRGWRRNRLRTASGFIIDALGLETASRGVKVEDQRPDLIVPDDIDGLHDSPEATKKKLDILASTVLPLGSEDVAILFLQNVIIPDGVVAQLTKGTARILASRIVSGPIPAVRNLKTEQVLTEEGWTQDRITGGVPTWKGLSLAICQGMVDDFGLLYFLRECQHEVDDRPGALWKRSWIQDRRGRLLNEKDTAKPVDRFPLSPAGKRWYRPGPGGVWYPVPDLQRIVVAIDPAGSHRKGSAETGIVVAALGTDKQGYVLEDLSGHFTPNEWAARAVAAYHRWKADAICGERNYGGDMVESTVRGEDSTVNYQDVEASRGKAIRAEPVASFDQEGRISHLGSFPEMEHQMCTWEPGMPSPDRIDARVWAFTELMVKPERVWMWR